MTGDPVPGDSTVPAWVGPIFGDRANLAVAYAEILADDGVRRGLVGPREAPILWERHVLNCAQLADHLPASGRVVDVGSGAGLPGMILAIRRPELRVDLVEPLLRRVSFLMEVVERLGLAQQVRVIRGRAEDPAVLATAGRADWVTARAVAPLGRLVRWCLPLTCDGGTLLALKGARAAEEIMAARDEIASAGARVVGCVALSSESEASQVVLVRRTPLAGASMRGIRP